MSRDTKFSRRNLLAATGAGITAGLAGCGDGDDTSVETEAQETETEEPEFEINVDIPEEFEEGENVEGVIEIENTGKHQASTVQTTV